MSPIKNLISKVFKAIKLAYKREGWSRQFTLACYQFPGEFIENKSSFYSNTFGIEIPKGQFIWVLESFTILKALRTHKYAKLEFDGDSLSIIIGKVKLLPTTAEEIFIIAEIFLRGVYNFEISNRAIVIDVGLNVGTAALFFATKKNVHKVFAFEPFVPTFKRALLNIAHNKELANKIITYNLGLGVKDETLHVTYDYQNKGQVGIHGTALIRAAKREDQIETIELKEAAFLVKEIVDHHRDYSVIMKIDCEGAEYGIIDNLAKNRILEKIDVVFIEWHEIGPSPLLEALVSFNFSCFYQYEANQKVGMIYARR